MMLAERLAVEATDRRFVTSNDSRAKLRAWTGNGSVDLGAWTGDASSAWEFYHAVRAALADAIGPALKPDIKIAIYSVEDDAAGERAPYSSPSALIMQDMETGG